VYALTILTWTIDPERSPRPWTAGLFWSAPIVVTVIFSFLVWPVLERYAPGSIYRLANERAKRRIQDRALESIRVGDRVEDLNRRVPGYFPVNNRYVTHNPDQRRPPFWQRGTRERVEYRVYFRDGVVSRLVRIYHREKGAERRYRAGHTTHSDSALTQGERKGARCKLETIYL